MWDLIALLLILLPVDAPAPASVPRSLWDALIRQACRLELTGDVEPWRVNFQTELQWCRYRFRELANAPPLSDVNRLPDLATIRASLDAAETYLHGLELRLFLERDWRGRWFEWGVLRREAASLEEFWAVALRAASPEGWVSYRRRSLAQLRDLLGGDYHEGRLPPPVPLWRMRMVD